MFYSQTNLLLKSEHFECQAYSVELIRVKVGKMKLHFRAISNNFKNSNEVFPEIPNVVKTCMIVQIEHEVECIFLLLEAFSVYACLKFRNIRDSTVTSDGKGTDLNASKIP